MDFDPTDAEDWHSTGKYSDDVFVTKLHVDGSYGWTRTLHAYGYGGIRSTGIAVDSVGNIIIAGSFDDPVDFDPTSAEDWYSVGSNDYGEFVTKISRGAVPVIAADADHDGYVRFSDLDALASHWLGENCQYLKWCEWTDFDRSTKVNLIDFSILADNWLWQPPWHESR